MSEKERNSHLPNEHVNRPQRDGHRVKEIINSRRKSLAQMRLIEGLMCMDLISISLLLSSEGFGFHKCSTLCDTFCHLAFSLCPCPSFQLQLRSSLQPSQLSLEQKSPLNAYNELNKCNPSTAQQEIPSSVCDMCKTCQIFLCIATNRRLSLHLCISSSCRRQSRKCRKVELEAIGAIYYGPTFCQVSNRGVKAHSVVVVDSFVFLTT